MIVEIARKYIGTEWRHAGRNKHGLDCVGLLVVVAREAGINVLDDLNYSRTPQGKLVEHTKKHFKEVPVSDIQDGDFGLFRVGRFPFHAGIFANIGGQRTLIHSHATCEKVIEEYFNEGLQGSLTHVFRVKK